MANTVYDEETYLEKLRLLSLDLKALAVCRVRSEHLDALGVPDGSVVFSRPRKRYRARSGEETVYQYTNEYLYIGCLLYTSPEPVPPAADPYLRRDLHKCGYDEGIYPFRRHFGAFLQHGSVPVSYTHLDSFGCLQPCKQYPLYICGSTRPVVIPAENFDSACLRRQTDLVWGFDFRD